MRKLVLTLCFWAFTVSAFADIGWYIVPYKRLDNNTVRPYRYPAILDYTQQIKNDGGKWAETDVLGNRAIVKVKATTATLTTIDGVFKRIPASILNNKLSSLTTAQKTALRNEMLDMGYTLAEIQEKLPNDLGTYTLRDVLKFMATRRLRPRYNQPTDTIICDGIVQPVRTIESVDNAVN